MHPTGPFLFVCLYSFFIHVHQTVCAIIVPAHAPQGSIPCCTCIILCLSTYVGVDLDCLQFLDIWNFAALTISI